MFDSSILMPGDSILYRPSSFAGVAIAIKTFSWTSHIEGYIGNGRSIGARDTGVKVYLLRNDKYAKVILRPKAVCKFDFQAAMDWYYKEADGDSYDFTGLFAFFIPDKYPKDDSTENYKKEFCSMLIDMWYVKGGFRPFQANVPSTEVSPAQFLQTPLFDIIWQA